MFDDAIVMSSLGLQQDVTAKKVKGIRGFLLNISKTVQLIFSRLMSFLGSHLEYLLKLKMEDRSFIAAIVSNS